MKRKYLATISCIILAVAFYVSIGLFLYDKVVQDSYEQMLYYPEDLYKEYQKEVQRMIDSADFVSEYKVDTHSFCENGRITWVIKIGDYDKSEDYANFLTATVKNFGTNEQEVTFERSRKSAEEAYEQAEMYKKIMPKYLVILVLIAIAYSVVNAITSHYKRVIMPILFIFAIIAVISIMVLSILLSA